MNNLAKRPEAGLKRPIDTLLYMGRVAGFGVAAGLIAAAAMVSRPPKAEALPFVAKNNSSTSLEKSSGVSEKAKKSIQQATVRVIIGNTEGTGVLYKYRNQIIVLGAGHTGEEITNSNPFGLMPENSPPFNGSSRAVDFALSSRASGAEMYIADTGSESTKLADIKSAVMGPVQETGDLMLMTLDSASITPAMKSKHPLPASRLKSGLPEKNSNWYLYGNRYETNRPQEAYAKYLGTATVNSITYGGKSYHIGQKYMAFAGNWPSPAKDGCSARTSGMGPISDEGTEFTQSFEINYKDGWSIWQDTVDQTGAKINPNQSPVICYVVLPNRLARTHSSANVLSYLWNGRGYYPGR